MLTSATADAELGASLFFKAENLQRMGAFKFRGAYNALACFDAAQKKAGVVAFSSGNHAQAIALSARLLGMPAVIVMPHDAPAMKVQATRGYGGEVVVYDRYTEDREAIGRRLAEERGMTVIPPFDHPDVIAGQGTAAKELFETAGPLDALFVCMGGGGLLSGSALAARSRAGRQGLWRRARSGQRRPAVVPRRPHRPHRDSQDDRRRRADPGRRQDHLRDHPSRSRRHLHRHRRRADRLHALPRRADEDPGRADRLPRLRSARRMGDALRGKRVGVVLSGATSTWPDRRARRHLREDRMASFENDNRFRATHRSRRGRGGVPRAASSRSGSEPGRPARPDPLHGLGLGLYVSFALCTLAITIVVAGQSQVATSILSIVLGVLYVVAEVQLGVQRSHDMDISGWWTIAAIIPFVGLFWS